MAPEGKYTLLRDEDDNNEFRSSKPPHIFLRFSWLQVPPVYLVVSNVLTLTILLYVAIVLVPHDRKPSFFPPGPLVPVALTLQPEYMFSDPGNPLERSKWDALAPLGMGFVRVPDPESLGLKGGLPSKDGQGAGFGVSVFHQIHCVAIIKSDYMSLLSDNLTMSEAVKRNAGGIEHAYHCFEYLRQAIMCAGDLTLEPEHGPDGGELGLNGHVRMCRNWQMIFDFTGKHNFDERTGLLDGKAGVHG